EPGETTAPARRVSRSSASSTSRARLVSGNSLPPASSCSATPISRKNAMVSPTENARSTRRTTDEGPPQKSRSLTETLVTLQRLPPLTRIFAPGARAPSRTTTEAYGLKRRMKIAVARPAAPAPTIATSPDGGRMLRSAVAGRRAIMMLGRLPLDREPLQVGRDSANERIERLVLACGVGFADRRGRMRSNDGSVSERRLGKCRDGERIVVERGHGVLECGRGE